MHNKEKKKKLFIAFGGAVFVSVMIIGALVYLHVRQNQENFCRDGELVSAEWIQKNDRFDSDKFPALDSMHGTNLMYRAGHLFCSSNFYRRSKDGNLWDIQTTDPSFFVEPFPEVLRDFASVLDRCHIATKAIYSQAVSDSDILNEVNYWIVDSRKCVEEIRKLAHAKGIEAAIETDELSDKTYVMLKMRRSVRGETGGNRDAPN